MKASVIHLLSVNWKDLLFGEQDISFLWMVALRTCIMFLVVLVSLRLLGKRGASQLSVFELGVIIGLGSAAGDPMFYQDVGILFGILVFAVVVALYHLLKFLIGISDQVDEWVEGKPKDIVYEGELVLETLANETITRPELFSQLRCSSVSHLGQVRQAILEANGALSIFYYPDDAVKDGLSILPQLIAGGSEIINEPGKYACTHCGHTLPLQPAANLSCPRCRHCCWIAAVNDARIT